MLEEPDFLKKVMEQIACTLFNYQAAETPESDLLGIHEILAMTPAQQAEINLTLNPHQFLEYLLFSVKGVYSKKARAET